MRRYFIKKMKKSQNTVPLVSWPHRLRLHLLVTNERGFFIKHDKRFCLQTPLRHFTTYPPVLELKFLYFHRRNVRMIVESVNATSSDRSKVKQTIRELGKCVFLNNKNKNSYLYGCFRRAFVRSELVISIYLMLKFLKWILKTNVYGKQLFYLLLYYEYFL